jgi:signal transduction histidine kinase
MCEVYDHFAFRFILKHKKWSRRTVRRAMLVTYGGTLLSSVTIAAFCIAIAVQQQIGTGHFLPLFLLVSASIFATMNNHQLLPVLLLRLSIYIVTVIFIPARDVWIVSPPLSSDIWLHLFTVLFVLAFILELSRSFLVGYSQFLKSRRELEEEHKRTKQAYETKTRFLATVSHELRTPLTSIKGALELINSGSLGAPPRNMEKLLEIATRNSARLHDLVGDILFIQSAEVGRIDYKFEPLELGDLVKETVERFRPYAEKLGVDIDAAPNPLPVWVTGDRKRLDQVLMNLLSNAAKFSAGQSVIKISIDNNDDTVRLSVADQGIGIAENMQEAVFAEFIQLDAQDDRKFGGTGLGLSISKRIMEAHGGQIGYESQLDLGTTFFIDVRKAAAPVLSDTRQAA